MSRQDLQQLCHLYQRAPSLSLHDLGTELGLMAKKVETFINVPSAPGRQPVTAGNAKCAYRKAKGKDTLLKAYEETKGGVRAAFTGWVFRVPAYQVTYLFGKLNSLAHELTHVAVNEAYGLDFIDYPNRNAQNVPPREYFDDGSPKNEALRQGRLMHHGWNKTRQAKVAHLKGLVASSTLDGDEKSFLTSRLDYANANPHTEYDTVINQVLVWLVENDKYANNQGLFHGVDGAARQAYRWRQEGKREKEHFEILGGAQFLR